MKERLTPMRAQWRDEIVTVVSVKGGKVQIAWRSGLRWVKPDELAPLAIERARPEKAERALEGL